MPLTLNDLVAISRTRHMVDGGEVRRVRERAGRTQQEIAEFCDVTTSAVSRWEAGEIAPCSANARQLAEVIHTFEQA